MIKHIVMFKFDEKKKGGELDKLVANLGKLPERIDVVRSYEIGINVVEGPRNYDVVLVSTFDSREDLKTYAVSEPHMEFLEYMNTCVQDVKVVDFEY